MRTHNRLTSSEVSRFAGTRTRNPGTRRLLALLCVACLVLLQCFVISPAISGQAHAADKLTIDAEYQDEASTYARQTVDKSWLEAIETVGDATLTDEEGNETEVSGPTLAAILKETGISSKVDKVVVGDAEISNWKNPDYFLVLDGDTYQLYEGDKLVAEDVGNIYVKRASGLQPVSFSSKPASNKTSPTVGDTIKVTYKLSVDKFYKKSDDYDKDTATKLTWSGNSKVKLQSKSSTGTSGSIKAKVTKSGSITITPSSEAFPELTEGVKVSFTGQNTTTTTKAPTTTRSTYTPYRPTTRSGGIVSRTTGTTGTPTTATRPTETSSGSTDSTDPSASTDPTESTAAPSFQTISVKEVYLTAPEPDPYDPLNPDDSGDWTDVDDIDIDDGEDTDDADSGVTFPAAAGSAAVAVAACGAGAVGRVRRFRLDMGDVAAAAGASETAADGKRRFLRGGGKTDADKSAAGAKAGRPAKAAKSAAAGSEKAGRNPLKKLRKK